MVCHTFGHANDVAVVRRYPSACPSLTQVGRPARLGTLLFYHSQHSHPNLRPSPSRAEFLAYKT